MERYEVGQVVEEWKGHADGTNFNVDDSGATLLVFFNNPTPEEIEQFKSESPFEIRFVTLKNIMMMNTKIGNLAWMDAPYTPHLSKGLSKFTMPSAGEGLGLMLMLIDARTGEIKTMRLLGLSEKFTRKFFADAMEIKMKEFDEQQYRRSLSDIYRGYSTEKLVKMAVVYCKVR